MTRKLFILIGVLFTLNACASVPIKQKVSATHLSLHASMMALDDLELQLCAPVAPQVNHCTSPAAATVGLTDAVHQDFSRRIAKAYETDGKISGLLIAWHAGDPKPAGLDELLSDAQATATALQTVATTGSTAKIFQQAQDWIANIQKILALVSQGA